MTTTDRRREGGRAPLLRFALEMMFLATAVVLSPAGTTAAVSGPGWRACLSCHSDASLTMTTAKGEKFSLTVAAADLAGSAHRSLECRACHPGVKLDAHPGRGNVASLAEYRVATSRTCLVCHPEERLRARSQHGAVVFSGGQFPCAECHGSHGVKRVAALRQTAAPEEYCLSCHSRALTLRSSDGGTQAPAVDAAQLRASVHPKHTCSDCHSGYSTSVHPESPGGDRNRRSIAATRTCSRCHADKLRQAEGSIHFTLLRSGVAGAPGCTDCHGAHQVAPRERYATIAGTPCRICHPQVLAAYSGSMHGRARESGGHLDAPLCSDCHRAHDVQGSASPNLIRNACIGCHPTAEVIHAAWLPNAALHLDAVSCAACHAPQAERVVALRLVEVGTGRTLTEREVGDLLGVDAAAALNPEGGGMSGLDLWSAMRRLESRRVATAAKLNIVGRLEVARGIDAHRLADKSLAVRSCESCHTSGSGAFDRVALSLARDDGRPKRFAAAPGMLTDAASVVSVPGFYALGATRQGVLDWLLILAVAGGLMVVALHLSFRLRAAHGRKEG